MNRISTIDLSTIQLQTQSAFNEDFVIGSKIFISGATGFFGKWLLESFLFLNEELGLKAKICALSRDPEKFLSQFPLFAKEKSIQWIEGDIKTFEFPFEKIDYIIHAATDADALLNVENPLLMLDTITDGTKRVLELAKRQPWLKGFLMISSGAIYGSQPHDVSKIKESEFLLRYKQIRICICRRQTVGGVILFNLLKTIQYTGENCTMFCICWSLFTVR
jgi:dTDP-glucose 4,6-dehydratase